MGAGGFFLLRRGGAFRLWCDDIGYRGIGVESTNDTSTQMTGAPLAGLVDNRLRLLEELVVRHVDAPLPESAPVLRGLGEALLWESFGLLRERAIRPGRDWALAVRTALELNLGTGASVHSVLSSLPLSYRQLCRCFRDRYGTSPKAFQSLLRIDDARRMLSATPLDVTSIATELGYSSSQHFASHFRRMVGCSPTEYRRMVKDGEGGGMQGA